MLPHLRLQTRIYSGFGLMLAIAVAIAVLGYSSLGAVTTQVELLNGVSLNTVRGHAIERAG